MITCLSDFYSCKARDKGTNWRNIKNVEYTRLDDLSDRGNKQMGWVRDSLQNSSLNNLLDGDVFHCLREYWRNCKFHNFIVSFIYILNNYLVNLTLHGREILNKCIHWTLERSTILGNADFMVPRDTADGYMGLKFREFSQFDIYVTEWKLLTSKCSQSFLPPFSLPLAKGVL